MPKASHEDAWVRKTVYSKQAEMARPNSTNPAVAEFGVMTPPEHCPGHKNLRKNQFGTLSFLEKERQTRLRAGGGGTRNMVVPVAAKVTQPCC